VKEESNFNYSSQRAGTAENR